MRFFHSHSHFKLSLGALLTLGFVLYGQVFGASANQTLQISDGWVRETNPGQVVGAVYMTIKSQENAALVAVESTISPSVEIHTMQIEKGVMKMRMLETLPLPANQAVKLAPGGLHIMLFDLKAPLVAGQTVPLTLYFTKVLNGKPSKARFSQTMTFTVKSAEDGMHQKVNDAHEGHESHHHH
jgi:periplasmic copper chaperone A